jgi:hypothetical protein
MTISIDVALWSIGILFMIGMVYGDIKRRLSGIENLLGKNGTDGVFVRKELYDEHRDHIHNRFEEVEGDIEFLKNNNNGN